MQLMVRDVVSLLKVPEERVRRWVDEGEIPYQEVNEQVRFSRLELLEWAAARNIKISPALAQPSAAPEEHSLADALRAGAIHYRVGGTDKPSVLKAVVDLLHVPDDVDRETVLQVLLAREELCSTGIGGGIAIPHLRNPIVLNVTRPTATLCFLERPVDFGAIDGQAVRCLFMMVSPTVRSHQLLLSKLAYALHDERFRALLAREAPPEEIFSEAQRIGARPK
jgi:PTS system nitrogen regulatory IIA component